ncbi:MAG TPA: hypothetical protein VK853_04550 [Ilumatobacteraceae bacterium]|nr:hypothetical protein [Ilumatobacteraceae bacterium]
MNDTAMIDTPLAPPPGPTAPPPGGPPLGAPSPSVRTIWLVIGSLIASGMLLFGTITVVDVLAHERTTEVTTHEGVRALVIDSDDGTVLVRAGDVSVVTVTARISEGLRATGVSRSVDGDRLVLRSSCPNVGGTWCSVDWDVVVPVGTDVTLRSDGDRAEAAGELGAVDLRSEHGGVTFDGVARSVVAESEHGNVSVRLAEPPDTVRAISEHGNVTVVVPDIDDGYRVEASTGEGRTEIGIRTDPNAARTIEARSEHGRVAVLPAP